MWTIPPFVGQKITPNPTHENYKDYMRQSGGRDGYILRVGTIMHDWLATGKKVHMDVVWENGHVNGYSTDSILPLSSFKEVSRYELNGGAFLNVYDQRSADELEHQIVFKGRTISKNAIFDKETRLALLQRHVDWYENAVKEREMGESAQMRYAGTLEELERTRRTEPELLFIEGTAKDMGKQRKSPTLSWGDASF
jgi:hypothetical protein